MASHQTIPSNYPFNNGWFQVTFITHMVLRNIKVSPARTTKIIMAYKRLQQSKAFIHTHGYLYIQASMCKTINTTDQDNAELPINTWPSWLRPCITYCLLLYLSSMVLYIQAHYTNALKVHWTQLHQSGLWIIGRQFILITDHTLLQWLCAQKQGNFCANSLYCYKNIIFKSSITMSAVPLASTVVLHNYFME